MPEAFDDLRMSVDRFCLLAGLESLNEMMSADAEALCGSRHARSGERKGHRWGTTRSEIAYHGGKVKVERPRVRDFAGREMSLPSWELLSEPELLQAYRPGAWQVKRLLTEDRVSATSAIAVFVGTQAYEAAGGQSDRDLFAEEDERGIWFDDPDLLNKLAMDSFQAAARELDTRWKWAEARLDVDWSATTSFGRVRPQAGREYVDVRALLLDPVDLRGIPWRDGADRTRWAPPAFLPPSDADGSWLINLGELPSALPMVQAALYQLVLDRKCGEYELPEGAALIACGNREGDRGVVHRMPAPLASRFVHLEIRVDATDWCAWGAANGIAPEVLFFVSMRPELLHAFNPQSTEKAFPCPRTWEIVSNIVHRRGGLDPVAERALFRGTVGEAAAVEFSAFLKVWHELPHPRTVIDDPEGAVIPGNASALIA